MIIGISGKKQSGKDTTAKIWQLLDIYHNSPPSSSIRLKYKTDIEWVKYALNIDIYNSKWEQKSFAYKLKEIICILTGCTIEQLEDEHFKNSLMPEYWNIKRYIIRNKKGIEYSDYTFSEENIEIDLDFLNSLYIDDLFIDSEEFVPTYRWFLQNVGTEAFRNNINPNTWINALFVDYKPTNETQFNWLITDCRFPNEADSIKERDGVLIRIINSNKIYKDLHKSEIALDYYTKFDYIIDNNKDIENLILGVKGIMLKEKIIK